jgi:hypothetical protein
MPRSRKKVRREYYQKAVSGKTSGCRTRTPSVAVGGAALERVNLIEVGRRAFGLEGGRGENSVQNPLK